MYLYLKVATSSELFYISLKFNSLWNSPCSWQTVKLTPQQISKYHIISADISSALPSLTWPVLTTTELAFHPSHSKECVNLGLNKNKHQLNIKGRVTCFFFGGGGERKPRNLYFFVRLLMQKCFSSFLEEGGREIQDWGRGLTSQG